MQTRFKERAKVIDIVITALSVMLSVGTMLYGIFHFGLRESWPELVLNMFYIACVVMIWMYFFNTGITTKQFNYWCSICVGIAVMPVLKKYIQIITKQFNYWCSICVGIAVLLRDILFPPTLAYNSISLACSTLSVTLLCMLTYFYARKDWKSYTKRNLYLILVIDMLIAILYNIDIVLEPSNEYTEYLLTEIWIRPTITYGLVACFVSETINNKEHEKAA